MNRPRALVFDWDNTLIESWEAIHHALVVTFETMGQTPWTLAETKARVRHSLRDAFPRLFGDRWDEARKIYMTTFTATHLERIRPALCAAELLGVVGERGFYRAVVSNKTGPVLRREAEHLGWTGHFARLVGAGDAAADKPNAAPMHMALDGSGIGAGPEVWYIGDTAIDMECAATAGCVGILVGDFDASDGGFARFPPARHFPGCAELAEHLRGL